MSNGTFMDKFRIFFGLKQEPPRNDFRNPIWSSDDEDDEDELYTRQQIDVYTEPMDLQQEITKQMQDVLKTFGNMFGDMKTFLSDDHLDFETYTNVTEQPNEPDTYNNKNIRDYYLKPGYHHNVKKHDHLKEDIDLDGKISSQEIAGMLKQKEHHSTQMVPFHGNAMPFNGNMVPGRSFCQTIITTSVTKADGTKETRRIVKNGNEVIEETTTSSGGDARGPLNSEIIH